MEDINFCSNCGSKVVIGRPPNDNVERPICLNCGKVHYHNPKIMVACAIHRDNQILWIKRTGPPMAGMWALPGGFVEANEILECAASRELFEETRIQIPPEDLVLAGVSSVPHLNQIYLVYRCEVRDQEPSISEESSDSRFFVDHSAPWTDMAFPTTAPFVKEIYRCIRIGKFKLYTGVHGIKRAHSRSIRLLDSTGVVKRL